MNTTAQLPAVKAILFDFGGVLAALRAESHLLPLVTPRMSREQMWSRWSTSPAVRAHETGAISAQQFSEQIVTEFDIAVSPQVFLSGFHEWIVGLYPETPQLIREVASRYTTALLTNTSALHWPIIESLDVLPHMHQVFASHQIGRIKPDPAYFEHVLEHMRIAPEQAVFFDDSALNVAAAQALGLNAYRVDGAAQVWQQLTSLGLL